MLSGRTVLVVETQYIVALDLAHSLEALGAGNVIIAQDAQEAQATSAQWLAASLCIVELERERGDQIALVGDLMRMGLPVIGLTTDRDLETSLAWLALASMVHKPVQSDRLIEAIARVTVEASGQNE